MHGCSGKIDVDIRDKANSVVGGVGGSEVDSSRTPFISKWQLNPDKILTFKLNNNYAYNFVVNWGDGSAPEYVNTSGTVSHTYTQGETEATITIHGNLPAFAIQVIDPNDRNALIQAYADFAGMDFADLEAAVAGIPTSEIYTALIDAEISLISSPFNSKILEIINLGDLNWQNLDCAFANQNLLTKVSGGNLTNVKSMKSTFFMVGNNNPVEFDTSTWNLINLESAKELFQAVHFAPTSNLSGMKFSSKLVDVSSMFSQAVGDFSTATDWNFSGVSNMNMAFRGANISNLNSTSWSTNNVVDFSYTFNELECTNCNFSGFRITSNTKNTSGMFYEYKGPASINLGASNMSEVMNSSFMFYDFDFSLLTDSSWIVVSSKNNNISSMFERSFNLNLDTSSWNTINVENYSSLFYYVDMDQVNTSGIVLTAKATTTENMFNDAYNLTLNTNAPGKSWDTSSVVTMKNMFFSGSCKTTTSCDFSKIIPSVNTTNISGAFYGSKIWTTVNGVVTAVGYLDNFPPIDTTSWDTRNVTDFSNLFASLSMSGSNLSGLKVTNKAIDLRGLFSDSENIVLDTTAWDISNVTEISYAFTNVDLTNVNLDGIIPSSNLENAMNTFEGATNLTLNTSSWDISGLKEASYFFHNVNLINVNLAGFKPKQAMQNFQSAFEGTSNMVISTEDWDLSNSVNIKALFGSTSNSVITLKDIDFSVISLRNYLFWSNHSHIIIEGTTTDIADSIGDWTNQIWCPSWAGTSFAGFTCQKTAYPGP